MTKVTLQYDLTAAIDDAAADAIGKAQSTYGIARLSLAPSLDKITIDYDATRLTPQDVEAALIRIGVPIKPHGAGRG